MLALNDWALKGCQSKICVGQNNCVTIIFSVKLKRFWRHHSYITEIHISILFIQSISTMNSVIKCFCVSIWQNSHTADTQWLGNNKRVIMIIELGSAFTFIILFCRKTWFFSISLLKCIAIVPIILITYQYSPRQYWKACI